MSSRRALGAFTILELTIAMAIAAMLVALALPPLDRWLRDGTFRAACERLEAGLERCRSDSMRRGLAVASICRSRRDGTWELVSRVVSEQDDLEGADEGGRSPTASGATTPRSEKVLVTLDRGISLKGTVPGSESVDADSGPGVPESEFVLAFFFPDGSAAADADASVRGSSDRVAEIRVNSWTGAVRISSGARDAAAMGGRVPDSHEGVLR